MYHGINYYLPVYCDFITDITCILSFCSQVLSHFNKNIMYYLGAKGIWDFWISDQIKNPDGSDI